MTANSKVGAHLMSALAERARLGKRSKLHHLLYVCGAKRHNLLIGYGLRGKAGPVTLVNHLRHWSAENEVPPGPRLVGHVQSQVDGFPGAEQSCQ